MVPLLGEMRKSALTVMVLVATARVMVALFVAVNVLGLVILTMTRAPQITDGICRTSHIC